MRQLINTHVTPAPTKAFPTLVKRVMVFKTSEPTRYGYKAYKTEWSLDGITFYPTAKQAKAST